jgi:hypothetical protein
MWELLAMLAPMVMRGIGAATAAGDYEKAEKLRQQAIAEYNIKLPDLESLAGELKTSSALQEVISDPQLEQATNDTLGRYKDIAFGSGSTPEDELALDTARLDAGQTYSGMMGRNQALRAARGQVGGGGEAADAFAAASAGADRAHRGGLEAASAASNRRTNALASYGSLSERLKAADLAQKNLAAQGQDRLDEFNTKTKLGAAQDGFENAYTLGQGRAAATLGEANYNTGKGRRTEETYADVGEGISRGAEAYGQYEREDKKKKPVNPY